MVAKRAALVLFNPIRFLCLESHESHDEIMTWIAEKVGNNLSTRQLTAILTAELKAARLNFVAMHFWRKVFIRFSSTDSRVYGNMPSVFLLIC